MLLNLNSILFILSILLGVAISAPLEGNSNLIHEYIIQEDGTVDHFAYHSSFTSNSDFKLDNSSMNETNMLINILAKRDYPGKSPFSCNRFNSDEYGHFLQWGTCAITSRL